MPIAKMAAPAKVMPVSALPNRKKTIPRLTAMTEMTRVRRLISFCSGLSSSFTVWVRLAMAPISVLMPVAMTTARPEPDTTLVPANTRFGISIQLNSEPSCTGSENL